MAGIVGTSGFTGGYVGSTPVQALYLGQDLVWTSSSSGYTIGGQACSTGSSTASFSTVSPAFPGYKIRIKGTVLESSDYSSNRLVFGNSNTGANYTNFIIGPRDSEAYMNGPKWRVGGHVFAIPTGGIPVFGDTIDWNLEPDGIYDNNSQSWVTHGISATAVSSDVINVYFRHFKMSIFQVWSNDSLVFDGRAASRNSDGQGGLFDLVSNTFYTDENHEIIIA